MGVERQIPRFSYKWHENTARGMAVLPDENGEWVRYIDHFQRIADLAAEVERLTGERDRQYEFNAAQITKHAELEATNETLKGAASRVAKPYGR